MIIFSTIGRRQYDWCRRITVISMNQAQAEDSQQRKFPLSVEYVGKLADVNWLTQINLRLSDDVSDLEEIMVRIRVQRRYE